MSSLYGLHSTQNALWYATAFKHVSCRRITANATCMGYGVLSVLVLWAEPAGFALVVILMCDRLPCNLVAIVACSITIAPGRHIMVANADDWPVFVYSNTMTPSVCT